MLSSICLSLLALISTANATPLSTSPHIAPNQRSPFVKAPLLHPEHPHGTLNNSFIVMLKQDLSPELKANHFNFLQAAHNSDPLLDPGSGVQRIYEHINGYSGRFTENVVDHIRSMPEVDFVERDQIVRTMDVDVQKSAPWVS
jgi:cerevisin